MAFEQKNNSGSIFENDRKKTDQHPDMTGSAVVSGREYWVSAWRRESKGGVEYIGFELTEKAEKQTQSEKEAA